MLSLQHNLVDSYDRRFLAFDGHCYMCRAVKRVLERQAARVLWGEARQTLAARPRVGASTPRTCSRAVLVQDSCDNQTVTSSQKG